MYCGGLKSKIDVMSKLGTDKSCIDPPTGASNLADKT